VVSHEWMDGQVLRPFAGQARQIRLAPDNAIVSSDGAVNAL